MPSSLQTHTHTLLYMYTIQTLFKVNIRGYLHAVGELVDDVPISLASFWPGKHDVASMQYHHHLVDVLLGLGGVDKEQVSPEHTLEVEGKVTATQLAQGNGVVHLLHQAVHHLQGILCGGSS